MMQASPISQAKREDLSITVVAAGAAGGLVAGIIAAAAGGLATGTCASRAHNFAIRQRRTFETYPPRHDRTICLHASAS